jgi:GrpB-like predicted nucleotidyltransferase (UPF0157 family)
MKRPVKVEEYDPEWSVLFENERQRILNALGSHIVRIEHIGSTAVVGLGAKPIIDMMIALKTLSDADRCIDPLERIGYQYVPEHETATPERRYFHKGNPPGEQHYHIHMVEISSDFWMRHLLFRDYLRMHPEVAQQYYRLKRRLAAEYGSDRDGYTQPKTAFIEDAVSRAQMDNVIEKEIFDKDGCR